MDQQVKGAQLSDARILKDSELNSKVKSLAVEERKLTQTILLHIVEVDRRKSYLKMAYPSLFDYLTKEIGYSAGAAHRRIDAARLMIKVPEVSEKIATGDINLSQISKVQKLCRQMKKESGQSISSEVQREVLQKIENKNNQQTDLILAQEFNQEIKIDTRVQMQKDESERLELTFTKQEMEVLRKAQSLLSNKTGGGLKDTILEMANKIIHSNERRTFTSTVEIKKLKSVTPKLRKEVLLRDQSCQFKDLKTGKICGAKHFLEVDHIVPKYFFGPNIKQNLRILCRQHNQFRSRTMVK